MMVLMLGWQQAGQSQAMRPSVVRYTPYSACEFLARCCVNAGFEQGARGRVHADFESQGSQQGRRFGCGLGGAVQRCKEACCGKLCGWPVAKEGGAGPAAASLMRRVPCSSATQQR